MRGKIERMTGRRFCDGQTQAGDQQRKFRRCHGLMIVANRPCPGRRLAKALKDGPTIALGYPGPIRSYRTMRGVSYARKK